jgi:hypothetical protein
MYKILIKFRIPTNLIQSIKMCMHEMSNRVHISTHLTDSDPIHNKLKQRDAAFYSSTHHIKSKRIRMD